METQKLKFNRFLISIITCICIFVNLILLQYMNILKLDFASSVSDLKQSKVSYTETFINNTIREQQRIMLQSVRESWDKYVNYFGNDKFLLKDKNNNYIYENYEGKQLSFNPSQMILTERLDGFFNICDLNGKVLLSKCRIMWNISEINKPLDIITSTLRAFGKKGNTFIYDAYTMEILKSNFNNIKIDSNVIGPNNNMYLNLLYKSPSIANPEMVKRVINTQFNWRSDSDINSKIVLSFNQKEDLNDNFNNFKLYPLGTQNRQFIEIMHLPFANGTIDGQKMELVVVLSSDEQELAAAYKQNNIDFNNAINKLNISESRIISVNLFGLIISIFIMAVILFGYRLSISQIRIYESKIMK